MRLYHSDFDAVNWRQRIEQATPLLAAIATHPELTGRGAEVERRRAEVVDIHTVAEHREEALLLGHSAREPVPRASTVLAPPHRGSAARTRSRHPLVRHDVHRVGIVRVHDDRKPEI